MPKLCILESSGWRLIQQGPRVGPHAVDSQKRVEGASAIIIAKASFVVGADDPPQIMVLKIIFSLIDFLMQHTYKDS